jgi:hypothetical protein
MMAKKKVAKKTKKKASDVVRFGVIMEMDCKDEKELNKISENLQIFVEVLQNNYKGLEVEWGYGELAKGETISIVDEDGYNLEVKQF